MSDPTYYIEASQSPSTTMEQIDFHPRRPVLMFIVTFLLYVIGTGTCLFFAVLDLATHYDTSIWDPLIIALIVIVYLSVGMVLFFYAVFSAYRFRFTDDGIDMMTWRGRQFFPWSDVEKSWVSNSRGTISLELNFGGRRNVTVPLDSYYRSMTLYHEIARRLPVATTSGYIVPADEEPG